MVVKWVAAMGLLLALAAMGLLLTLTVVGLLLTLAIGVMRSSAAVSSASNRARYVEFMHSLKPRCHAHVK